MSALMKTTAWRPIVVAWLLTVGVDLFFNAGVFAGLFDQEREPALLPDEVLFRRIPVAYLALAIAVMVLAWLFDRIDVIGTTRGATVGGIAGVVAAALGIIALWTAIDMTGLFVVAGSLVQIIELGTAGAFYGSYRGTSQPKRSVRWALVVAVALAVLGIVFQNLL